jgi:hypothetical protein
MIAERRDRRWRRVAADPLRRTGNGRRGAADACDVQVVIRAPAGATRAARREREGAKIRAPAPLTARKSLA